MTYWSNLSIAIQTHNFRFFDGQMPNFINLHYLYIPYLSRHIFPNILLDIVSKLLNPIEHGDITQP